MNPIKGEVPLVLSDGQTFTLVMDFAAMVAAEAAYQKPLVQLGRDASAGFAGATCAMFYGALQANHPRITLRDATNIFGAESEAVIAALEAAEEASALKATGGTEGKESANPPGKTSGGNGAKSTRTSTRSGGRPPARSA